MFFIVAKTTMNYNKNYKIDRRYIFFTFPKSEITADKLIEGLVTFFDAANIEYIVVGGEEHKDGSPHLHCVISLKRTIRFQVNKVKKLLNIKHFNDAGVIRSMCNVLKYVTKDGEVTCYPKDLNYKTMILNAEKKKGIKADLLTQKLIEDTSGDCDEFITDTLSGELGGFALFRAKAITDAYKIYHGTLAKRNHIPPCLPPSITTWILGQNHPTVTIWSWLQRVLNKGMKLGDRHLYIWGPTMSGKTSLINYLMELGWQIYLLPKNEDFFDGFTDKKWDLAIADEVRGGDQKVQFWNQWCDSWMKLKVKGKQAVLKARVIPTILLSNYLPAELFPKIAKEHPDVLAAFERRWEVVSVGPGFGLIDLPK